MSLIGWILCLLSACGATSIRDSVRVVPNLSPANVLETAGSTGNCAAGSAAPAAAQAVGFQDLVFCDDFDNPSTIDVNGTGKSGYNWYTNLPFGAGRTQPAAYTVSNSMLIVTANPTTWNWGLTTMDPLSGSGMAWTFGYFEARISFDPSLAAMSSGWPAFWTESAFHARYNNSDLFSELDVFEAYGRCDMGTLHQWQNALQVDYWNSNHCQQVDTNWNNWHVVAARWIQGQVTWYLDGVPLMTQEYSPTAPPEPSPVTSGGTLPAPAGTFSPLDSEKLGMQLVVGSEPGWPLQIDWVRVWH